MGVETSLQNPEISQDIYSLIKDGDFSDTEKNEIEERYGQEREEVRAETQTDLSELRKTMQIYEESLSVSNTDIRKIQIILSMPNRDGVFGPNTFSTFSDFSQRTGFTGGLMNLIQTYEAIRDHFEEIPDSEKTDYQPAGRKDGLYGQGTFEYILVNNPDFISEYTSLGDTQIPEVPVDVTSPELETDELGPETGDETTISPDIEQVPAGEDEHVSLPKEDVLEEVTDEIDETQDVALQDNNLDNTETLLSFEEKTEKFISEAQEIPNMLIKILQESVQAGVDGDFGPNTARKVIEKYPSEQSLTDIMLLEGIPLESDGVLPGSGGEDSRDILRARYGEFIQTLEVNLDMPHGLVEAIIRQETHYGTYGDLISYSGCKGLMQLSGISMEDMKTNHRGNTIYRDLFQSLDINSLLSTQIIDGKTVEEMVPRSILGNLQTLNNSESTNQEFDAAVDAIQSFLKDDNSYFNHAMNLIMGSIYLSGTYHDSSRGRENIRNTADHYNAAPGERAKYRRNVEQYFNEIQAENRSIVGQTQAENIFSSDNESVGPDDGLRGEAFSYREVFEKYNDRLQASMDFIERRMNQESISQLALHFGLRQEEENFAEKLSLRVLDFQEKNGLVIDGKPGRDTLSRIDFS